MQKRNKRVDAYKDKWALMHGIPIMRIWEIDIRNNPSKVMNDLKERLRVCNEAVEKEENGKKRHNNFKREKKK